MTAYLKEKYLLFRAKNKDPEAFSQVYDLYAEKIYRYIFFKVRTQEDAQDLTSEVFLKTWQYISENTKEIKNLNALFYKIARNLVIDYYRKLNQQDMPMEQEVLDQQQALISKEDLQEVETKIEMERIEEKLRELKDEYRDVIILRYIEQMSVKEIAKIIDKKSGAVRVMIYRALNILKELMEAEKGNRN